MSPVVTRRPPREGDADIHFAHPPEAEIVRMFGGHPDNLREASLAWSKGWFDWLKDHRFGRIILADGRPVGEIRLHTFKDEDRPARPAPGLFSTHSVNQSTGQKATQQTLSAGFDEFALARVDLRVLAFNIRAIRCYQACGFKHISTKCVEIMGKPEEEWTMSCEKLPQVRDP